MANPSNSVSAHARRKVAAVNCAPWTEWPPGRRLCNPAEVDFITCVH